MYVFSGARLRFMRRRAGLSPERLAVAIDRSYATITLYERDRVVPPGAIVSALADAVGCTPGDLFVAEPSAAS